MAQAMDGLVASGKVPDNTRAVRGASHHHRFVILQAKDGTTMVEIEGISCRRPSSLRGYYFSKRAMAAAGDICWERRDCYGRVDALHS